MTKDKHSTGSRMCSYTDGPACWPLIRETYCTCFCFLLKLGFPQIDRRYFCFKLCNQNTAIKNSFTVEVGSVSTWVPYLTRLRRRLIAYSWLQTHSQGSKPPSAISTRPWDDRKRLWGTEMRVNKWEKATCWQCFVHRYTHKKGRRLLKRDQSAALKQLEK